MKLEEIMVREVVTVAPDDTIEHASQRMLEKSVGCPVVTVDSFIKGILTDRDLLYCIREAHDVRQCSVSTHMSRPVVTERPDKDIVVAAKVMMNRGVKRLPIVEGGKVVGIISLSDVARVTESLAASFGSTWASAASLIVAQANYRARRKELKAAARPLPSNKHGALACPLLVYL